MYDVIGNKPLKETEVVGILSSLAARGDVSELRL
jgi:hypothetical protein